MGNSAAGKTASGNMYAEHDGNVYKNTGNGWDKYDNGSWNSVNKPQPNWQGAENNQQREGSESYQQRSSQQESSEASSSNRSAESSSDRSSGSFNRSGGGGGSGSSNLDREAQNRSRGDFSSQRFQGFQAGAATALAAEADSVVIVPVVSADSAAVIALAVEHSAGAAALADSAGAAEAGDEN